MSIFWQQVIIGVVIALAVAFLVYHQIQKRRRKSACDSCQVRKAMIDSINKGSNKKGSNKIQRPDLPGYPKI